MGRFSKSETVFYRKLYRSGNNDADWISEIICWLRSFISKEYYSLPYFAIRKTGIDYIFRTHAPRVFFTWNELERIDVAVSSFVFSLKSGDRFRLKFSHLDYSSIQLMKDAFSDRDLLNKAADT